MRKLAERWAEAGANQEHWRICSKTLIDLAGFFATNGSRHSATFLCTRPGKADWTMLGRNMVGFAPSFIDNLRSSQYERHEVKRWLELTLCPRTPPWRWPQTQLQPMCWQCLNSPFKCVALHKRVASLFYISASSKSFQRWLPEWRDTHVSVM